MQRTIEIQLIDNWWRVDVIEDSECTGEVPYGVSSDAFKDKSRLKLLFVINDFIVNGTSSHHEKLLRQEDDNS